MMLWSKIRKRFALSDSESRKLRNAVIATLITDCTIWAVITATLLFVTDMAGDNEYALGNELWTYIVLGAAGMLLLFFAYRNEYNRCFADTYDESRTSRITMIERLRRIPLSFFSGKDPTELSSTVMGDVSVKETTLAHWVPSLISSLIFTPVMAVIAIAWSPLLGVAMVWPIPVAFLVVFSAGRIQESRYREKFERMTEVSCKIQETLECSRDLRSNDAVGPYLSVLDGELDDVEGSEIRCELAAAIPVIVGQMVLKLGIATTVLVGSMMLIDDRLSLIGFVMALIVVSRLYDPLNMSLSNIVSIRASREYCKRIDSMNGIGLQSGSTEFEPKTYDIVFDDVSFGYIEGQTVLDGISFTARQGETTALIGPSGCGKTTIARLTTRFWDIERGRITIGGVDISTIDPETLMSKFSIVFQDVVLFNTSVMENIRIGRKDATDEEVLMAAKMAMCDDFVSSLPEGYGTVIGENGARLSGGERQRISIARAILKDAPIVVLDEATASLDAESERHVQEAISHLISGKTVLIVAHRMRTVMDVDRIVVIGKGRVVEEGSPSELLSQGGIFSGMVYP